LFSGNPACLDGDSGLLEIARIFVISQCPSDWSLKSQLGPSLQAIKKVSKKMVGANEAGTFLHAAKG
jgi:hypothetical protein